MTTYYHGGNPEMETDGIQTLYLMNPNYITAYNSVSSEHHQQQQQQAVTTQQQQNMILLNSAMSHPHVSLAPPSLQSQFLTLPFAHPISADDPSRSGNSFQYNSWTSGSSSGGGNGPVEVSGAVALAGNHPYQIHVDNNNTNEVFRRPSVLSPATNQQGLSLSLSSQSGRGGVGVGGSSSSAVQVAVAGIRDDSSNNNGMANFIIGSKFLKAAQELLDEVVNVGKATATKTLKKEKEKEKMVQIDIISNVENEAARNNETGGSGRAAMAELSMTQKQEIQMKKTKLIGMLDEVEQSYRQYHHQMKTVVTSFEQVAGFGSARSYTSLALRTISKQFRCLKDTITSQIKEASNSLGEEVGEDCLGVKGEGSMLRMFDHQIRQQRALQQLGMIQHNAWRPQRGLPERAVSVLRAWLFEHFLHPYPKDSDKHMLAKQTGLTRNQVSNWFINARVRLWKPMVEEMYLEEVKDHPEQKGSNQDISSNKAGSSNIGKSSDPNYKQQQASTNGHLPVGTKTQNTSPNDISNNSTISTSPNAAASFQALPPPGFSLIGPSSSDMDGLFQYNKKARGPALETENSPSSILSSGEISFSRHDHQNNNLTTKFGASSVGYSGQDHNNNNNNGCGGFGAYHHQLGELGRFNANHHHQMAQSFHQSNNGNVSLTLGLPPGENLQQSYFSSQNMHGFDRRVEMLGNGGGEAEGHSNTGFQQDSSPHSNMGFLNMDIQNQRRYASAAAPLLPDFVA